MPGLMFGLSFSADGAAFAGAGMGGLRVWDPATGEVRAVLARRGAEPRCLAFARNGPGLVVSYHDGSLAVWDVTRAAVVRAVLDPHGTAHGLAYDAGRKILATAGQTHVSLWDAETLTERWALPRAAEAGPTPVALSADGRWVACADGPTTWLVDARTGRVARTFRGHVAAVSGLAFAPESDRLYSSSFDTTVLVWEVGPPAP
jgi:WD40 repeat protein